MQAVSIAWCHEEKILFNIQFLVEDANYEKPYFFVRADFDVRYEKKSSSDTFSITR